MNDVHVKSGEPADAVSQPEDAPPQSTFIIATDPAACTGCMRCRLACADVREKVFSPSLAHIQVVLDNEVCSIRFDGECTSCGVCADHCFSGALRKHRKEAA